MNNKKILMSVALAACLMFLVSTASAQFTQVWKIDSTSWPIQGFNTNNMRGAALNSSNGHYLVGRKDLPRIYVFNATNGTLLDSLNMTGVTGGGGSVLQDIEVTSDGVVYASNLVGTPIGAADTTFKIYRWANDNSATVPTVAFSGRPLDKNGRFGDAFDVAGTGTGTVIYVGGNNTGTDSVLVFTTTDGTTFTNSSIIKITGNDAGMGIAQLTPGGDFLTSRYSSGNPIRLYSGTGAGRLDAVPTTVTPAFQADITYLVAAGRKWVASVESLATAGHGHKAVLLNVTYGLSGAIKVGTTPVIGRVTNTSSIGGDVELQYNTADSTMTIFLMVDNNGIAAYKTGNLLLANLKPFAGNIRRTQYIPIAGQNDTVLVDAQDDSFIPKDSVRMNYTVDGATPVVVVMSRVTGDSVKGTYQGVIPGSVHTNGKRIAYSIIVSDNLGVVSTSGTSGYFAGLTSLSLTGPRAVDTNGVLLYDGYGIRISGVCIQEDSITAQDRLDAVIQDKDGGVNIFRFGTVLNNFARGRGYTVEGELDHFRGKIELIVPGGGTNFVYSDNGPAVLPKPRLVTVGDLLWGKKGEEVENMLIMIQHVVPTPGSIAWPPAGASGSALNMMVTDNGKDSTTMRLAQWGDLPGLNPKAPYTVIGVAGQYNAASTSPFTNGYQVIPLDKSHVISEVMVHVKDTTRAPIESEVDIPVMVPNITGWGITGFNFDILVDSTALQFISASNTGSISAGYSFTSNVFNKGSMRVVGSGAVALKDSGALFTLRFKVLKMGASMLTVNGMFNEGTPVAAVRSGVVVGTYPMELEPNDAMNTATKLPPDGIITGMLSSATGDPDYFVFTSQVGHLLADVTDAAGTTDADVYLYDSTGKLLYNVDRNLNDRLEFNLPYTGKYFVKVSGFLDGTTYATGPYQLFVRNGQGTDANEPNDGPLFGFMNVATPITFNMTDTTNSLNPGVGLPGNDYDYFQLIAAPKQTISALVQMKTFKSSTTLNNVQARIYRKGAFGTALVTASKTDGSDITIAHAVAVADTYYIRIVNVTGAEGGKDARYKLTVSPPTGVFGYIEGLPLTFALDQNFPNPFNPTTTIRFALPTDASTKLVVYDMLGREVSTLVNNNMNAGYHQVSWNGRNNNGLAVASGMYIYRIEAGSFISIKKMMLLK